MLKSKIALAVFIVAAVAIVVYFASYHGKGNIQTAVQHPNSDSAISTNLGSVAGVSLNSFAEQANQAADLSVQDSANAAAAVPADGSAISSQTDAINSPVQ